MYGPIFDFTHEFTASWTDIDPRTTSGMEGAVIRHPRTSILPMWLIKHVWIRHTSTEQDSWDHICGPSCISHRQPVLSSHRLVPGRWTAEVLVEERPFYTCDE